jgi:hypothetical protein
VTLIAIEEQLARGRELTKKMQSIESPDDDDSEELGVIENAGEPFIDVEDPGTPISIPLLHHTNYI